VLIVCVNGICVLMVCVRADFVVLIMRTRADFVVLMMRTRAGFDM
jgi:hypothetical protein